MKRPTDEDRVEALQRLLVGLARGTGVIYKLVIDMTTNTIVHFNTDG